MKKLLFVIVLLFLITRLYKIDQVPYSLYWDEASIGFNAYSILKTGKDEWGETLPLHFKAYGEYKLPLYIYTVSLTQFLIGPSELAVRLPSVFFGAGTIVVIYLLALRLFHQPIVALLSAFLLSISPWYFIFSRTGYEASAGLFFYLLGILLWLNSRKNLFYLFSIIAFIISLYSYNSFRILLLPTLIILFLYEIKNLNREKVTYLAFSIILLLVCSIPAIQFLSGGGSARLETVGIFDEQKKAIEIFKEFLRNYLAHLEPQFLLFQGDVNLRSQQQGFGQLYLIDSVFILLGVTGLLKARKIILLLPIFLLAFSLLPAAITKESPHALRSITATPFLSIISAYGIYFLYKNLGKLSSIKNTYFYSASVILIYLIFFSNYFYQFVSNFNNISYEHWQYAYKKIFEQYTPEFHNFDHVVISDRYNQPYIFALFYLKVDPEKFRREVDYNQSIRKATSVVRSFDKFVFTNVDFYNLPKGKNLIFSHPTDRMTEINEREVILNPDGTISAYVYEYQN